MVQAVFEAYGTLVFTGEKIDDKERIAQPTPKNTGKRARTALFFNCFTSFDRF